jgi:alpha-glucosidase (family GH31 glycosyl hydrolase)
MDQAFLLSKRMHTKRLSVGLSLSVPIIIVILCAIVVCASQTTTKNLSLKIASEESSCQDAESYPTYRAIDIKQTDTSLFATLQKEANGIEEFGSSISNLKLLVYFNTRDSLRILIRDADNQRWEPDDYPNPQLNVDRNYKFELNEYPFGFKVTRLSDGKVIWDTMTVDGKNRFYYADQYLEIGSRIPDIPYVYGLGERVTSFRLDTNYTSYTLWTLAQDCPYDTGKDYRGRNMYGHHPVYLEMRNGKAHAVFLHNFNAMETEFTPNWVSFKTVGGVIDLYLFMGPKPEDALEQYHSVIGYPQLPPYWAMGYHQCRWGYADLGSMSVVLDGYNNNGIPLDVLWSDIDYMTDFWDFTLDYSRFPKEGFSILLERLHSQGKFYVPIVDAGVAATDYFAYNRGLEMNVFIRRHANDTQPFVGLVWPGKAVFPDFFHPNASKYWSEMFEVLYEDVKFDGIWLDMNEGSSFCDGECPGFYASPAKSLKMPYTPGRHSLEDQVLPLLAKHYGGPMYIEYNVHSLYSYMQVKETHFYLKEKFNTRPFILSRSTRAGQGKYGFHWLGDNYSTWEQLRYTIQGVLNFQIFGIPLVGADVCGFHNNTTPELCSRWLEVGSFYTFFRNHNDIGAEGQELFVLGEDVMNVGRKMIRMRYSLHLYMYSLLFKASYSGGSVLRPMFFEYPNLIDMYENERQIMLGPAILVIPVLEENQRSVIGFIPDECRWYDYWTGMIFRERGYTELDTPLDDINILIRGGHVLPLLNSTSAMSLTEVRQKPIELLVALDCDFKASGTFYNDDGVSLETIEKKKYSKFEVKVSPSGSSLIELSLKGELRGYLGEFSTLNRIRFLGLEAVPKEIKSTRGRVVKAVFEEDVLVLDVEISLRDDFIVSLILK